MATTTALCSDYVNTNCVELLGNTLDVSNTLHEHHNNDIAWISEAKEAYTTNNRLYACTHPYSLFYTLPSNPHLATVESPEGIHIYDS